MRCPEKKKKQGFTLLEMLVTVAILAVLAAAVIPSVLSIRDGLLFRQRTDRAKTIFLTAQRQLIHLRAAGETDALRRCPAAVPQGGADAAGLRYVTMADAAFDVLVPEGSLEEEILSGCAVIEFSPETGSVSAVYYTEESDLALRYGEGSLPRNREDCREALLGYHGGDNLSGAQLGVYRVAAEISYTDGQAGLVTVHIPTQDAFQEPLFPEGNYQRYAEGLKITLTVTGERGGVLVIPVKEPGQPGNYTIRPGIGGGAMLCYTVCLDGLAGGSFGENGRISAGDNVALRADVWYLPGSEDPLILVDSAVAAGINPMFASFSQISPQRWALTVSNGRHLQNLNAISPEIAGEVNVVVLSVGGTGKAADQVIDWQETADYYGGSLNFTPIHSPYLFGSGTFAGDAFTETALRRKNAQIVGCGTVIKNLRIDSELSLVGLFACLDTEVDGIYLAGPVVRGGNALAVGALAGAAGENCAFTDCGILSEEEGTGHVTGSGAVGGLLGYLESSRETTPAVRNCFSSISVSGEETAQVGGFVGINRNAILRDCHVALTEGKSIRGSGFAAQNGGTIRNCYVLAEVEGEAGFAARNSGTIRSCFANVRMESGSGFVKENTGSVEGSYGWIAGPAALEVPGDCRGSYFARLGHTGDAVLYDREGLRAAADHIDALAEPGARTQLGDLWYRPGRFPAHPADENLKEYPYPMNGPHYGDWALPGTGHGCGVLYYERYRDGSVGVRIENLSQFETGAFSPLQTGAEVLEAGYGLYFRTGTMPFDRETEALLGEPLAGLHDGAGLPEIYTLRALQDVGPVTVRLAEGYDSVSLVTWYADTIHRVSQPFAVRCQSQLENVKYMPQGEFTLEGMVSLDETYEGPAEFSGVLTGAEGSVIFLQNTARSLVGTLTGRLQNLKVAGVSGLLTFGALADRVEGGRISDCDITAEIHTAAGAVAGTILSGKIRNCTVSGPVTGYGESCGSFAGEILGGEFRDCHVQTDNGLPFAGKITPSRQEIPENATHFSETYAQEGRYAQGNAERQFTALGGPEPVYDARFENCTFLDEGQQRPVMSLRYYYRLEAAPGYQAFQEGPDTGRYALVTAEGFLLGVNENGQMALLRDFAQVSIPEADIWIRDEEGYHNAAAPDARIKLTLLSEGEETWVRVEYTEILEITLTQPGPDGTVQTVTNQQQQLRQLDCKRYRVDAVTDWLAVCTGKTSIPTEVKGG